MPRTLVIYHYCEVDAIHKENLEYFLRHGYKDEIDYIVVIAGGCTFDLPVVSNIRYLHIANSGFDLSGYVHAVNTAIVPEEYGYFIFLNSSVRGPFLPAYCETCWTKLFTDMLNDDVRLVGATINIFRYSASSVYQQYNDIYGFRPLLCHVQTMLFGMERSTLEFLLEQKFFQRPIGPNKADVIVHFEIHLSQLLIRNGWNISCIIPEYRQLDYRTLAQDVNPTSSQGDACWADGYFHRSLSPYETIFIKTNRNLVDLKLLGHIGATQAFRADAGRRCAYKASKFNTIVNEVNSAWKGHKDFAIWLCGRIRPAVIVDLGVDFGFSTFCLAVRGAGQVYGVDSFQGDEHAGFRDTQSTVETYLKRLRLRNVTLIKGYFDTVASSWAHQIDALHIDGRHLYEDIRNDFENWSRFVNPHGVVLLHDTCVPHFGVRQFFDEIQLPKINLWNSYGLGVISRDASLIQEIASVFEKLVEPGSLGLPPDGAATSFITNREGTGRDAENRPHFRRTELITGGEGDFIKAVANVSGVYSTINIPRAGRRKVTIYARSRNGDVHTNVWHEMVEFLYHGLRSLRFDVLLQTEAARLEGFVILIGAIGLTAEEINSLPQDCINYNSEHVGSRWIADPNHPYRVLLERFPCWDYSLENSARLKNTLGISAQFVPIGYVPEFTRVPTETQDIDVLFYGSGSERRDHVLNTLRSSGVTVHHAFGVYGLEKDALIGRSKIVLNMHQLLPGAFEIIRVAYLLSNGKAVVCERNENEYIDEDLTNAFIQSSYEGLASACISLLKDSERRKSLEKDALELFSKRSAPVILRRALLESQKAEFLRNSNL